MLLDGVCHALFDGGLTRDIQLLHMEVARCTHGGDIFTYSDGSSCVDTCWLFPDACQSGDLAVDSRQQSAAKVWRALAVSLPVWEQK
jgi:hypothetical protein